LMLVPPTGEFAGPALGGTIEELSHHYKNVLVLMKPPSGSFLDKLIMVDPEDHEKYL